MNDEERRWLATQLKLTAALHSDQSQHGQQAKGGSTGCKCEQRIHLVVHGLSLALKCGCTLRVPAPHQACQRDMGSHAAFKVHRVAAAAGTAHQLRSVALSPHRCQMSSMRL